MFWIRTDLAILALLKITAIVALIMALSIAPAGAGPAPKGDPKGKKEAASEEPAVAPLDPHLVFMPALAIPVVDDGTLIFYYYVGIQLRVPKLNQVPTVKEHVPLLQDAFIRFVHKHPVRAHDREAEIDKAGLVSELMPRVSAIVGAELVDEVIIESVVRSVI